MSAIFTKKGKNQFVKLAAAAPEAKADAFIAAGEDFKRQMEATQHVDVEIDKKGIVIPRLKATVIDKATRKPIARTEQMPWEIRSQLSTGFFERSRRMTEKADKAAGSTSEF